MKKWVGVLFVLFISIGLTAQFNSFRYLSTATLLEDNLELIQDPARVSWVEGDYLYTILFNPNTFDALFSNMPVVPSFFLGGKKTFGSLDIAAFVYDEENLIEDTTETVFNTLQDLDNEGTYDYFEEYNSQYIMYSKNFVDEYNAIMGFRLSENMNIGLYYDYEKEHSLSGSIFTEDVEGTDLLTGDILLDTTGTAIDTSIYEDIHHIIGFGMGIGVNENMRIGLRGGMYLGSNENDYTFYNNTFADYTPNDASDNTTHNYEIWDTTYINEEATSQMGFVYSLFTDWSITENDNVWIEFAGSYWKQNLNDEDGENYYGSYSYYYQDRETAVDYEVTEWWDTLSTLGNEVYYGTYQSYALTFDWIHTFDKNITFGMGVRANVNVTRTSAYDTMELNRYEYYNDGDGIQTVNDYTATYNQYYVRNLDASWYSRTISLPVCIEFPVWKENIMMRLGAEYTHSRFDYQFIDAYTVLEPGKWVINYGDGTTSEFFDSNPLQYAPSSTDYGYIEASSLNYTYGLGWNVSDNLTIDIMGFFNLTRLSNWNVSGTLKF